jgi:hypothetical protein
MKTMVDRLDGLRKLWAAVVPGLDPPEDSRLVKWLGIYSDSELEYAFVRVNTQLRRGRVIRETSQVARYVAGVLANEAQKIKTRLARVLDAANGVTR